MWYRATFDWLDRARVLRPVVEKIWQEDEEGMAPIRVLFRAQKFEIQFIHSEMWVFLSQIIGEEPNVYELHLAKIPEVVLPDVDKLRDEFELVVKKDIGHFLVFLDHYYMAVACDRELSQRAVMEAEISAEGATFRLRKPRKFYERYYRKAREKFLADYPFGVSIRKIEEPEGGN